MIRAVGQRGGWPLDRKNGLTVWGQAGGSRPVAPLAAQKGAAIGAGATRSDGRKPLRFGSSLARWGMDASVNTFQKINEVFLWGFLAQDIIGLWLPRVGTSLRVGRVPYDPATDPKEQKQPFHQQMAQWIKGNVQGLNWVNFGEETKREIATGPGLLLLPAVFFLGNQVVGNPAKEMRYGSLKAMGEGFQEHLATKPGKMNRAGFEREVRHYLEKIFVDDRMGQAMGPQLKAWTRTWTDEMLKHASGSPWERLKRSFRKTPLHSQAERLHEMVRAFNRDHRVLAYADNPAIQDVAPLHHGDRTWIAFRPDAYRRAIGKNFSKTGATDETLKKLVSHQHLSALTEDLSRFGGFVRRVWEQYERQGGKQPMAEVAGKSMRELVARKFLMMAGTTALTALYLVRLAFWSQNGKSYQAVRLLQPENIGVKASSPDKRLDARQEAPAAPANVRPASQRSPEVSPFQIPPSSPVTLSPVGLSFVNSSFAALRPDYRAARPTIPFDRRDA